MAKLINPLHSLTATGTVGRIATYRNSLRGAEAHTKPAPSKSHSWQQLQRRLLYSHGCAAWNALSPAAKQSWRAIGAATQITGFNAFMQQYLDTTPLPPLTIWDGGNTSWDYGRTVWLD